MAPSGVRAARPRRDRACGIPMSCCPYSRTRGTALGGSLRRTSAVWPNAPRSRGRVPPSSWSNWPPWPGSAMPRSPHPRLARIFHPISRSLVPGGAICKSSVSLRGLDSVLPTTALFVEAPNAGLTTRGFEITAPAQGTGVLRAVAAYKPHVLILAVNATTLMIRDALSGFAAGHRIPIISAERAMAGAGILMTYDPSELDVMRRSAAYVVSSTTVARSSNAPALLISGQGR